MDELTDTPLDSQDSAVAAATETVDQASSIASTAEPQISGSFQPVEVATSELEKTADFSTLVPAAVVEPNGSANTAQPAPEATAEKGISIIAREATVLGDIITDGHIDVIGVVRGNIAAQGDVAVHGQVRGNIDGEKIGLYNSRVRGNLKAGQGVIVNDSSIIDGDVNTKNIIFDGKVRGSIEAESVVVLRSNSYCLGDVTAASIAVEPGAIINGNVRTLIEGDPEAPFNEMI